MGTEYRYYADDPNEEGPDPEEKPDEGTGECRLCGKPADPEDGLCFRCWVRLDKAEADRLGTIHGA